MTAGVSAVLAWSCASIEASAAQLSSYSVDVSLLALEFTSHTDLAAVWRGAAGDAACQLAERVAGDVQSLVAILDETSAGVRAANVRLGEAQTRLASARAEAAGMGCAMDEDGQVAAPSFTSVHQPGQAEYAIDQTVHGARVLHAQWISRQAADALAAARAAERAVAGALSQSVQMPHQVSRGWILDESVILLTGQRDPGVQGSIDLLHDLVAQPGDNASRLHRLADNLRGMSPDQQEQYFADLSDAELAALDHLLSQPQNSGGLWWGHWNDGLSDADRQSALEVVLRQLDLDTLRLLRDRLGVLETNAYVDGYYNGNPHRSPLVWGDLTAPPFHAGDPINIDGDVNQGGDGDCWYLATLNAIAVSHPGVLVNNLQRNANGTYTVRFYVDGKWVPVTVMPDLPHEGTSPEPIYASEGKPGNGASWAALYEKAFAQLRHGYQGISGGWPTTSMPALLGPDAPVRTVKPMDIDLASLADKLDHGYPMTAVTPGQDDKHFVDQGHTVVANHVYTVTAVDVAAGTVTVRNPWGVKTEAGVPTVLTLTTEEFRKYFSDVEYAELNK